MCIRDSYKENYQFLPPSTSWEDKLTQGKGRSYGAELIARKEKGKITGWAGYTPVSYTHLKMLQSLKAITVSKRS